MCSKILAFRCLFFYFLTDFYACFLVFNFSTPYKRVHSDGVTNKTEKGYTHSWTIGQVDTSINLWRSYANYAPWYILAGVGGVLFVVIGAIVIAIINNKKKKQGMKALKKIANFQNNDKK